MDKLNISVNKFDISEDDKVIIKGENEIYFVKEILPNNRAVIIMLDVPNIEKIVLISDLDLVK